MDTDFHLKKRRHTGRSNYDDYNRMKKHTTGSGRDDSGSWRGRDLREKTKYINDRRDPGNRRTSHSYRNENKSLWDVPVNLIGQKENNPMIHMCSTCILPIKSYGRLIPCKHVFCFKCAKKTEKHCPRCKEEVHRIEQCRYGTVWMCNITSCNRTYLSQRDLQAHVNHRHSKPPPPPTIPASIDTSQPPPNMHPPQLHAAICHPPPQVPPMSRNLPVQPPPVSASQYLYIPGANNPNQIAADGMGMPPQETMQPTEMNARPSSNLITIPIQDDPKQDQAYMMYNQAVSDQSNSTQNPQHQEYLPQISHS